MKTALLSVLFMACSIFGCSEKQAHTADRSPAAVNETALQFADSLIRRDYARAYGMTTQEYQKKVSLQQMQEDFESIIPTKATNLTTSAPVEPLMDLADKKANELGMVYITIEGEHIDDEDDFDALTVIVADENGTRKISDIEYGRAD
jgi:hypothetical protein